MYFKKIKDSTGDYISPENVRYMVSSVRRVRNQQGVNVGCEEHPSLQHALESWGLRPVSASIVISAGNENQV